MNMGEKPKSKETDSQKSDKYLPVFMNKVVVCETMSGKTITGILTGYDMYALLLIDAKDIKSKTPMKTMVFKHGLVSIREME